MTMTNYMLSMQKENSELRSDVLYLREALQEERDKNGALQERCERAEDEVVRLKQFVNNLSQVQGR